MKRSLRVVCRWGSRAAAAMGLLLAIGLIVLYVRSLRSSDYFLLSRLIPAADPTYYDTAGLSLATGEGKARVDLAWGQFSSDFVKRRGWGLRPELGFETSSTSPPVPVPVAMSPEVGWGRNLLARLGAGYEQRHEAWNGVTSLSSHHVWAPLWLLAMLCASPAGLLLAQWRRHRHRRRGFPLTLDDPTGKQETGQSEREGSE